MRMRVRKEISADYQFHFPVVIDCIRHGGKILMIAREEGNWIVLDNNSQLAFFEALRTQTIEEALRMTGCAEDDARWVITQLVARHFEESAKRQAEVDEIRAKMEAEGADRFAIQDKLLPFHDLLPKRLQGRNERIDEPLS